MERKKLIALIAGGVGALVLLCILIVGIVDGIWPWDGPKAYAKIFKINIKEETSETQPETEPPTEETDPTQGSAEQGNPQGGSNQGNNDPSNNESLTGDGTTGSGTNIEVDLGGTTVVIPDGSGSGSSGEQSGTQDGDQSGTQDGDQSGTQGGNAGSSNQDGEADEEIDVSQGLIPGF